MLTTVDDQTKTVTFNITSAGVAPFNFYAHTLRGFDGVSTSFSLRNVFDTPLTRVELSCIDGAGVSATVASADELGLTSCVYSTPGFKVAGVKVYDAASSLIFSATQTIEVVSVEDTYRLARGAYSGMVARLRDGQLGLAVSSINHDARERYSGIFNALGSALPTTINQLGSISRVNVDLSTAEVVIVRDVAGERHGFLVYVMLCEDGIWRVASL